MKLNLNELKEETKNDEETQEVIAGENSKADFIPWILLIVGTIIGISIIKRTLSE